MWYNIPMTETKTKSRTRGDLARANILRFIDDYHTDNGLPPTYREIIAGCDVCSTSVLNYHLGILEKQGFITRRTRLARTLLLTPEGRLHLFDGSIELVETVRKSA